jgi:hypothetical protein
VNVPRDIRQRGDRIKRDLLEAQRHLREMERLQERCVELYRQWESDREWLKANAPGLDDAMKDIEELWAAISTVLPRE